jgi:hypothetical protein
VANEAKTNANLKEAIMQIKKLVEDWTNGRSLDNLITSLKHWHSSMMQDERFSAVWSDIRTYVNDAFKDPQSLGSKERVSQFNSIIDRARDLSNQLRTNEANQEILNETRALLNDFKGDPTTNKLINDSRTLMRDLFLDRRGNLQFKPEELNQFKILLTSIILEELKYVSLPRFSATTDEYDFWVSNCNLYVFDLLPDHIQIQWNNALDINLKDITADTARSVLSIQITHIKTHLRNVMFWFRKKRGLIKMEDQGLADVDLTGDGANLLLEVEISGTKDRVFNIRTSRLSLDKLRIHVVDSRYDWLLNLVSPFISNDIKRSIEREVERRICFTMDNLFYNLSAVAHTVSLPIDTQKVGEVIKDQLKDIQSTKDCLDKDVKPVHTA